MQHNLSVTACQMVAVPIFMPAIVCLLGDANLSAGFGDRNTLVDVDFSFPELVQDLVTTTEIYSPSVYGCDL